MAAGDYRIKRILVNGQPVYAVTRGQWGFPDDEFYDRVERIVQAGRDLWKTHDFPYYLVALLPTDELSLVAVKGGPMASLYICLRI